MNFSKSHCLTAAAALLTGILCLATPASAATLTFGSYGGNTATTGLSNTAITYDNTGVGAPSTTLKTGTVSVYTPGYSNTIAGTTWVSYDPNTGSRGDNGGKTTYTTSYTGSLAEAYGVLSIIADDTVDAYLNGTFIGTTAPSVYDTLKTFNIGTGIYKNGLNTFQFIVTNVNGTTVSGGPTGFDFQATAATPEPSSFIMLGTGLIGAVGMVRRRFLA